MFEAQGGYRLLPHTKLILGHAYDTTLRNYANTNLVTQSMISAKVRSARSDTVFGTLGYTHEDRFAGNYRRNNPWAGLGLND